MDWTEALAQPAQQAIEREKAKAWKEGYEQGFVDAKAVEEMDNAESSDVR
jgi:flagellar biosynthesis/type III secretory pathway protein FliH